MHMRFILTTLLAKIISITHIDKSAILSGLLQLLRIPWNRVRKGGTSHENEIGHKYIKHNTAISGVTVVQENMSTLGVPQQITMMDDLVCQNYVYSKRFLWNYFILFSHLIIIQFTHVLRSVHYYVLNVTLYVWFLSTLLVKLTGSV